MKIVFRIAFRNLVRQKRRNLLLGTGIAFGIMVLFISQSYTKGLSDILINSFISSISGHVQINVTEKSDRTISIIRDKHSVLETINETIDNVRYCWESVSTLTRVVGNGNGALMLVVGVEKNNSAFLNSLKVIDGDIKNFTEEKADTPIILYSPKAEELNVSAGDTVNIKMTTIYGQMQSARMTVAAIVKPENIFMNMAGFTSLETIKGLLGYKPHETAKINIVMENVKKPDETVNVADLLHKAFQPKPVKFVLNVFGNNLETTAIAAGLDRKTEKTEVFRREFNFTEETVSSFTGKNNAVIIGNDVARKLKVKANDSITISFKSKYEGVVSPETKFVVVGIIDENLKLYSENIFFNSYGFNKIHLEFLPEDINEASIPAAVMEVATYNKILFDRPADSKALKELQRKVSKYRKSGSLMYISSMKETAEDVLKIESALNLICFVTVIILFAIILTGAVNALRMTIRERTREIGTVRSIGMHKKTVVRIFVVESALLALFAGAAGAAVAVLIMFLLSGVTFQVDNLFSMLIDNGHIHFLPEMKTACTDIFLAVAVTVFTAWFPAKKASEMPVTEALRHYE